MLLPYVFPVFFACNGPKCDYIGSSFNFFVISFDYHSAINIVLMKKAIQTKPLCEIKKTDSAWRISHEIT